MEDVLKLFQALVNVLLTVLAYTKWPGEVILRLEGSSELVSVLLKCP